MLRIFIPILTLIFIIPAQLHGQTLPELMRQAEGLAAAGDQSGALHMLKEAYIQQWLKTPLAISKATFVSKRSEGYGKYHQRADNVFNAGEKMLVYIEPYGYGWGKEGDLYSIDFSADFTVSSAAGKVLGGRKNFQKLGLKSLARNTEFFISLTYTFSGIPKGDYVLTTTLNDMHSGKSVSSDLPFSVR